jgi:hypothetical protein
MAGLTADPVAPLAGQHLAGLLRASLTLVRRGWTLRDLNRVQSVSLRAELAAVSERIAAEEAA